MRAGVEAELAAQRGLTAAAEAREVVARAEAEQLRGQLERVEQVPAELPRALLDTSGGDGTGDATLLSAGDRSAATPAREDPAARPRAQRHACACVLVWPLSRVRPRGSRRLEVDRVRILALLEAKTAALGRAEAQVQVLDRVPRRPKPLGIHRVMGY